MSEKPLFSISTSSKKGEVATGFDASRSLSQSEERIITKFMLRLPRFLTAIMNLAEEREENRRILNETKKRIGGRWT